jgi:hypothetical protein
MGITHVVVLSTAWVALATPPSLSGSRELSRYRAFEFGMNVVTVAQRAGISPEPRVVHQRPELIQELMWLPSRLGNLAHEADSAQKILFTFYNNQLSRIVVFYDRSRTEGLTADDVIAAISATYGVAVISTGGTAPATPRPNFDDKLLAHWEDPQHAITLFRSKYLSTYGLVLLSKRLDRLAALAAAEALLMDEQAAPARETARQQQQTDEERVREATVRRVNKATFKP